MFMLSESCSILPVIIAEVFIGLVILSFLAVLLVLWATLQSKSQYSAIMTSSLGVSLSSAFTCTSASCQERRTSR